MKKFNIIILLTLFWVSLFGQITMDTTTTNVLQIIKLEKSGYKFMHYSNTANTISLYNIDYTLYKNISIPVQSGIQYYFISYITECLFNTDSNDIEYLMTSMVSSTPYLYKWTKVYDENSNLLFFGDSISLSYTTVPDHNLFNGPIITTDLGTKMILGDQYGIKIFTLPGKLECYSCNGVNGVFSAINDFSPSNQSNISTLPFPNPSTDEITIPYLLPAGDTEGEIIIYNTNSKKVKKYKVGNDFTYIHISNADLPAGTYYYVLLSRNGKSEGKKIIVVK